MAISNIIGNKYGKLTVIRELEERDKYNRRQYLCKCDCGNEKIVRRNNLICEKTKSCGCIKIGPKKKIINIIGNKYGKLTVIKELEEKSNNNQRLYLCKCDCGNEKIVAQNNLISGDTKSCGCIKRGKKKIR